MRPYRDGLALRLGVSQDPLLQIFAWPLDDERCFLEVPLGPYNPPWWAKNEAILLQILGDDAPFATFDAAAENDLRSRHPGMSPLDVLFTLAWNSPTPVEKIRTDVRL